MKHSVEQRKEYQIYSAFSCLLISGDKLVFVHRIISTNFDVWMENGCDAGHRPWHYHYIQYGTDHPLEWLK